MISLCVIHLCIVFMYCILILDSVWSEWAKHPYIYKRALLFTNLYIHLFILLSCDIHVRPCINLFCVFQSCIPFWVPTACGASGQSTREASPTSSQKSPLCLQKSPISPQRALYLFALHLHKRALCVCKRALYLHKEPCIYLFHFR